MQPVVRGGSHNAGLIDRRSFWKGRLCAELSLVLGRLSERMSEAVGKAASRWDNERNPGEYLPKIGRAVRNAKNVWNARVGERHSNEWEKVACVAIEQCGHDPDVLTYVLDDVCTRVTAENAVALSEKATRIIREKAFDRRAFEHSLENTEPREQLADGLRELREIAGVRDTRESRRLLKALDEKPEPHTRSLAVGELPEEVRAIMPAHVPLQAMVFLGEVEDPMARAVLSGDLKLKNVPPYFYIAARNAIEDAVVRASWKEALRARVQAEFGGERREGIERGLEKFYASLAYVKSIVENEPGMEKWRAAIVNVEEIVIRAASEYVMRLSFAYSEFTLSSVEYLLSSSVELFEVIERMNGERDVNKLLGLKVFEGDQFGLVQRASLILPPGTPPIVDGLSSYSVPVHVCIMGNECVVTELDGKVLRVMRDLPAGHTVTLLTPLLYANMLVGAFKIKTNGGGGIRVMDAGSGAPLEAKLRIPGVPSDATVIMRVNGEQVEVEHEGKIIARTSLSELRKPPVLEVKDNAANVPADCILRFRALNANFYIETSVQACEEMPAERQAEVLAQAFHLLCEAYGKDNASKVLLFTEDIRVIPERGTETDVMTIRYAAFRTKSGLVAVALKGASPADVACALVHEDGHGYAEKVLPKPFSRYLTIDSSRQLLGLKTLEKAFEEEIQEIFAELCVLKFARQALEKKVVGYREVSKEVAGASHHVEKELAGLERQKSLGHLSVEGVGLVDALKADFEEVTNRLEQLKETRVQDEEHRFDGVTPCKGEAIRRDSLEGTVIRIDALFDHDVRAAEVVKREDLQRPARQLSGVGRKALPSPHAAGLQPLVERALDLSARSEAAAFEAERPEDEIRELMGKMRKRELRDAHLCGILRTLEDMNPEKYGKEKVQMYSWACGLSPFSPWNSMLVFDILATARVGRRKSKISRGRLLPALSGLAKDDFLKATFEHTLFTGSGRELWRRYEAECEDGGYREFKKKVGIPMLDDWQRDSAKRRREEPATLREELPSREASARLLLRRMTHKGKAVLMPPHTNTPRDYERCGFRTFLLMLFVDANGNVVNGAEVLRSFGDGTESEGNWRAFLAHAGFAMQPFDARNAEHLREVLACPAIVDHTGINPASTPVDYKAFKDTLFWHARFQGNGLTLLSKCGLSLDERGYQELMARAAG